MDIISVANLASLLGLPDGSLDGVQRAADIIEDTNGLITEKWVDPVDPVPTSIKLLALAVAGRAWTNTPGQAPLQSVTKTSDNTSKTERYAVAEVTAAGYGVYLTDGEIQQLGGLPAAGNAGSFSMAYW